MASGTAPGPPLRPTPTRVRAKASRWYLLAMLLIVAVAAGTVAVAFGEAPIPPGVDPGHWLSISYSYVGLPTAPDPTDRPFFYSPLLFPLLGGMVLLTGNPLTAAGVTAVLLFALYGLSSIHLARRFVGNGALQVALVGLAVFSGTTIQMVFWGGYPNLLGFIVMNECLVFLLRFVRSSKGWDGAAFYALFGLCYFAHDLSFAVLVASVVTITIFLLLFRKVSLRFVFSRVNLIGAALLAAVIEGYGLLTSHFGIPHPSYFKANPEAYVIDEVGEIFAPLAKAPAYFPAGAKVFLPAHLTAVLLVAAPAVAALIILLLRRWAPKRVDIPLLFAAGWLAAALAVPGAGYLAHVETDFTRFLYFIPLPFALLLLLCVERLFAARRLKTTLARSAELGEGALGRLPQTIRPRRRPTPKMVANVVVAVALAVVFLTVTAPVAFANERAGTHTAHDQSFIDATAWLKSSDVAGNVLTTPSAARWTEGLSERNAFDVGPVWLLFDPFQIDDAQDSYWALTSQYAVTNNQVALAFSGFATPELSQAPMYTAYIEGVPFPVLRVLPGTLAVNVTNSTGTQTESLDGAVAPVLAAPVGNSDSATYSSPGATLVETATASPDGSAEIVFTITPDPHQSVNSFAFTLGGPPPDSSTLSTDKPGGVQPSDGSLTWWVNGKLGQYPTRQNVTTTVTYPTGGTFTPHPILTGANTYALSFPDPNGSRPYVLAMHLSTAGTSNPTDNLPASLSTLAFLETNGIHFLLWPTNSQGLVEIAYYEAAFLFYPVYTNSEWTILEQ
jgi:hypothetical protein